MSADNDYISYRIPVPPNFEEVFSHFYFAKNSTPAPVTKTLFPSYQTIIIFNFGPKASLNSQNNSTIDVNKCLALGPIRQAFDYTLLPGSEILVGNFKDAAFYRFFGTAMLSHNMAVDPDKLTNDNCFTYLWEVLNETDHAADKVNLVLEFCEPYLKPRDKIIESLVDPKNDLGTISKIKMIADITNQSERTVQINHKKYLGYSAKEISRYQRFLKAIELLQPLVEAPGKVDWFEIIHQCGYYDQSQLIHDFKHYIQLTPKQYVKFQQDICYAKPV